MSLHEVETKVMIKGLNNCKILEKWTGDCDKWKWISELNDEKWQNTDTQSMVMIWGHTQLRVIQVVWSKSASVVWLLVVYLFLMSYREQFVENINEWNNEFEDLTLGQWETWPR